MNESSTDSVRSDVERVVMRLRQEYETHQDVCDGDRRIKSLLIEASRVIENLQKSSKKKFVDFTCYRYDYNSGVCTLFLFYEDGVWNEDKLTVSEALHRYPPNEYEWIHFDA